MRYNLQNRDDIEILEFFQNIEDEKFSVEFKASYLQDYGYKSLVELAQLFLMKVTDIKTLPTLLLVEFSKLDTRHSFHNVSNGSQREKYGVGSDFFYIDKSKEVTFLYYYINALKFLRLEDKKRVLNLGVNKADEFRIIKNILGCDEFEKKEFVGVDYSKSIIEFAKKNFSHRNVLFLCEDITKLIGSDIGKFDFLISIGTLQSSSINFYKTFMDIYQNLLLKDAAILLGFPNCRWIDSHMIYGAKAPNYNFSEMGLVLKDICFCKKYLQQKGYRVVVTGKEYLFLSARKITTQSNTTKADQK